MTPDIAEQVREHASVVAGLAREYIECYFDTQHYADTQGIRIPHGPTVAQWGEEQCAVLASDMAVRCEWLLQMVEPGRVA
jgi:hypothetical protein